MDTILILRIFYNSETWTNITQQLTNELDKIHTKLLKRPRDLPDSTPKIELLCECGIVPAEQRIWRNKLIYHRKILTSRNKTTRDIITTQEKMQLPKCWNSELTKYIEENLTTNNEAIRKMDITKWTNSVNKHIQKQLKIKLKEKQKKTVKYHRT